MRVGGFFDAFGATDDQESTTQEPTRWDSGLRTPIATPDLGNLAGTKGPRKKIDENDTHSPDSDTKGQHEDE